MEPNSPTLTRGRNRAAARSFLKGIGFNDDDLEKPIVGIANTWTETMTCNYKLRDLAVQVKEGVRAAGGTLMEFNTIAVSDGIVAQVACDKTIPGAGMALLRLNVPGVILYGGSILPGRRRGKDITIPDVFEAMGAVTSAGR